MGFSPFRSDSVTFQASLTVHSPCAPTNAVAGYVVKAHSPPGTDDVSPASGGKCFSFSAGRIVTLNEGLYKRFLHAPHLKCWGAINKEKGS